MSEGEIRYPVNLKEREIWALIETYGKQLTEMHHRLGTFADDRGGSPKPKAVEIVDRLQQLVKELP